jgi:predicted lipoprotein with Yx(FWY)xxD motif
MTAYVFDKDTAGSGVSTCSGACVGMWPAITTDSATPDVEGITGTIGTIELANGSKQVTLDGLPLYTYAGDTAPGDTNGQGVSNVWWVVDSSGAKVTEAPEQDRGY